MAKLWPDGPLVVGKDEYIAKFCAKLVPHVDDIGPCTTIGIIRRNKLIGGFVFTEYRPGYKSINFSAAFAQPYWPSREIFATLADYIFHQLACNRVEAVTPKHNRPARKFLEWAGFKLEGCARRGFGKDDAMIYGMLRRECRWLENNNNNAVSSISS